MSNTYYVCSLTLQKEIIDHDGSKSLQAFKPGSKVELTEDEALKYQHLIETEEQFNSRFAKRTYRAAEETSAVSSSTITTKK